MKKTKLSNDFCNWINDGFRCQEIENADAEWCAGCLINHLKEVIGDLELLYAELVSDISKDKD